MVTEDVSPDMRGLSGSGKYLERFAGASAALFALLYAAGFLVVSLHHSAYGLSEFNLLTPRVFAAGVVLATFVLVPMSACYRLSCKPFDRSKPDNKTIETLHIGVYFYAYAFMLAIPFHPLLEAGFEYHFPDRAWILLIGLTLLGLGLGVGLQNRFRIALFAASVCYSGCLFTFNLLYASASMLWLTTWFFIVGVATMIIYHSVSAPRHSPIEWERYVFMVLIPVLFVFATQIYGRVKSSFGGGRPNPIVLHFVSDQNVLSAKVAAVFLIDETENGFYILRREGDTKTYFIRRDFISAVIYQPGRSASR